MRRPMPQTTIRLFELDVLLPAQFAARYGAQREWTPEQELLIAVLETARDDLRYLRVVASGPAERLLLQQARGAQRWVASTYEAPFSFQHVCGELGLDAEAVRAAFGVRRQGA